MNIMNNEKSSEELFKELMNRGPYSVALARAALLCGRKAKDYQLDDNNYFLDNLNVEPYFPFGLKSYSHMINLKSKRIVSLSNKDFNQREFESILDSALDLINYSAFLIIYLSKNKFKE